MIELQKKKRVIWLIVSLAEALSEIGLSQDEISTAERLNKTGNADDLKKHLRICRCGLMDELHHTQKKVDNLDFLLRQLKGGDDI